MSSNVIVGSENWTKIIPDKYAMKCSGQQLHKKNSRYRILEFEFVRPSCRLAGSGFILTHGIVKVPVNIEGIVLVTNDLYMMPDVYFRSNGNLSYAGCLAKWNVVATFHEPPDFKKVYHFSKKVYERQKSDVDAPEWLKKLAQKNYSNVAYFEF